MLPGWQLIQLFCPEVHVAKRKKQLTFVYNHDFLVRKEAVVVTLKTSSSDIQNEISYIA